METRARRVIGFVAIAAAVGCADVAGDDPGSIGETDLSLRVSMTSQEMGAAEGVFTLMNHERVANSRPALVWSPALTQSAHSHNLAMDRANVLSHQLPGEEDFGTRITNAGVAWREAAENIGVTSDATTSGAVGLQQDMYAELPPDDGHRLNILSASSRYVGVDVYIGVRGQLWLTEDFADAGGPASGFAASNPFGHFDLANVLSGHRVALRGWAADRDAMTVPLQIAVYYDGHGVGWFPSGVARPDVARIEGTGPDQGFAITVTLPAGHHSVCTYAINIGPGNANSLLGCLAVTD